MTGGGRGFPGEEESKDKDARAHLLLVRAVKH
jgi:hypothetical protein